MIFILKSNVGLGVLGIPWVFQTVGIVPGVILIIAHNFIVMWTAWVLGQTKMRHPEIYAFCDLGLLLGGERFGPLLREALNFVYIVGASSAHPHQIVTC
jgi:amino acid permease